MGSVEVLPQFADGYVEIERVTLMEDTRDEVDEQAVCRILVSSQLHLHGSKLHPPSDIPVDGDFEPNRVPISPIEHLEQDELLLAHLSEFSVHNQEVPLEDIRDMEGHSVVDLDPLGLGQLLYPYHIFLIHSDVEIVILRSVFRVIPQVVVSLVVTGCRDVVRVVLVSFFRSPVINAIRNNLPSDIPIGHLPLVERCPCSEGKQDGTDDIELVVDIPRMVQALGGKSALKTRISHPEGHRIHMNVPWIGFSKAQLGRSGVFILEDRDVYLHSRSPSHPDVSGKGAKARVVCDVVVVDIPALRDGIVEGCLGVSDPEEGYNGDGEGDSRLGG
jgi:hypothetical protein